MRTLSAALFLVATALAATADHHDHHRQLDAHVHGHGTLNVAIEDKQVEIELAVPGMDIVGFEHTAQTDAQKTAVKTATEELAKVLELFKVPDAAACSVTAAKAKLEGGEAGDKHDHDNHEHGDDHAHHDDQHDHDGHGAHNQFEAAYTLTCENPQELTSIAFTYFDRFAGAKAMTVNVVTAKGQSKYEVTREKPVLDLAGVM